MLPSRRSQVFSSAHAALGVVSRGTRSHEGGHHPVFVPDGEEYGSGRRPEGGR
jgi:hypothetical protein